VFFSGNMLRIQYADGVETGNRTGNSYYFCYQFLNSENVEESIRRQIVASVTSKKNTRSNFSVFQSRTSPQYSLGLILSFF
jgi:hypothetical protein